jgi:hypothetical protein
MLQKCCPKIIGSKKSFSKKTTIDLNSTRKLVSTKVILKKVPSEKIVIQDSSMLMCTNCGGKIIKPILPLKTKIYCIDCFRPLDLPESYYT